MAHERPDAAGVSSAVVRLAAVGDLLLASQAGGAARRDPADMFAGVKSVFDGCDIVFGNLECTLAGEGGEGKKVPTEPRVISTPELVGSIKDGGFDVVTLGNNHAFDCLREGFDATRCFAADMGIDCFGAGDDIAEAAGAVVLERNSVRVAFIGVVDRSSGPFQFAGERQWGVAPLDVEATVSRIRSLRDEVNHVIVSPHWGRERFAIPSPDQIAQARALVDAGASMVLGHHPHVIQGMEIYKGAPIIYSLGNFVANDVHWTGGDVMRWNRTERTGCILLADLTAESVTNVRQVASFDTGRRVELDLSGFGDRRIARVNRALAGGVTLKRYRREHLWVETVRPILEHLRLSNLRHLRPRHFRGALASLIRAVRAR